MESRKTLKQLEQLRDQYRAAATACDLTIDAIRDLGFVHTMGKSQREKKEKYVCCGREFVSKQGLNVHRAKAAAHAGKK